MPAQITAFIAGFCAPVLASLFAVALAGGVPTRALTEVKPFSASFKARDMAVTGGTLHVRVGGSGQVKRRLTPKEIEALPSESAGAGTSGLPAVTTRSCSATTFIK